MHLELSGFINECILTNRKVKDRIILMSQLLEILPINFILVITLF